MNDDVMSDLGPPTENPSEDIVYNNSTDMNNFLPVGEQQEEEIEAVRRNRSNGKGDPTNQSILRNVPLQERIKHLLKFAEFIDGKWVYRFANHPRFSYWAFNMIHRKRILQQSGIFIKQNPGEAHLTIDELREMAASDNSTLLMSKVSRYSTLAILQTALKGFLAQKFKNENDCSDTTELDQDIEAGQKAADTVCQYVDWLLSTVNPIHQMRICG
ncbi:Hypothetical predicted protein [Paramuricea clavata]|uniref:Uncharacterized protein n=1 Tax=Paramuricea clavata TaxID=317549 RepID=A0A7D9LF98_PARCT|nr:Hypothetical predicted protein [Paramuricea clavata]